MNCMGNTFCNLFPVPSYLSMNYAGIEIADTAVRFIKFRKTDRGLLVDSFGEVPLDPRVIERGFINDVPKVVEALKFLQKKYNLQ